jgi:hypothetical protein
LGDLEREKCKGFQQQIIYAFRTIAKDQRREQELDHGRHKAFGRHIKLISLVVSLNFLVWPRLLYVQKRKSSGRLTFLQS